LHHLPPGDRATLPSPAHLLELLEELPRPLFDLGPLGGRGALGALPELGRFLLDCRSLSVPLPE